LACCVAFGAIGCDEELLAGWQDPYAEDASWSDAPSEVSHDVVVEHDGDVASDVADAGDTTSDVADAGGDATPEGGQACELEGGTCFNVSPTSCTDGHWASPSTYPCDGSFGVLCCLPGPDPLLDAGATTVCEPIGGSCVSMIFDTCTNAVWDQPIPFLCGADLDQGCCFSL
jgi:hypothetical protein